MTHTIKNTSKKITCPRCGGNGEVEHSHVMFGICFMCKGSGMVYQKRVDELTERSIKRNATIAAKKASQKASQKEKEEAKSEGYAKWQYSKNLDFFYNKIEKIETDVKVIETLNGLCGVLKPKTELEVREIIKDYISMAHDYRYNISKWTLKNFNFIYMEIYNDYPLSGNVEIDGYGAFCKEYKS